jgi:hypothetical protein
LATYESESNYDNILHAYYIRKRRCSYFFRLSTELPQPAIELTRPYLREGYGDDDARDQERMVENTS